MRLDPRAEQLMARYLAEVDDALPGFVSEAYVLGSAVQDDFRPGLSDLNFAVIVPDISSPATRARVAHVHRRIFERDPTVPVDGVYLERREVESSEHTARGPHVRRGVFVEDGFHGRTALAWQALVECGEPVRGDGVPATPAWLSSKRLDASVLAHAEMIVQAITSLSQPASERLLSSDVLATARLHYTLATASLTSKTKAGLYGIVTFDGEWTPLVDAALRARREPLTHFSDLTLDRAKQFVLMVLQDMRGLVSRA